MYWPLQPRNSSGRTGSRTSPNRFALRNSRKKSSWHFGGPEPSPCRHWRHRSLPRTVSAMDEPVLAQGESFGEILRHELNNPLTGILGNAELLLAELRRKNIAPLSEPGVKRLETIAALAIRMRETVRRLSQACESRAEHVRSA